MTDRQSTQLKATECVSCQCRAVAVSVRLVVLLLFTGHWRSVDAEHDDADSQDTNRQMCMCHV